MKRTIPFTKTLTFKTMIAEITDIEVTHDLKLNNSNEIEGDILVDGKYKMTDASQIEEEFHYKLPFMIDVDSKYDTKDLEIIIGDFYFEIINEEDLKVNVEIDLLGLEEKVIEKEIIATKVSFDELETLELEEDKNQELVREDYDYDAMEIPVEMNNEIDNKMEIEEPLEKLEMEIKQDLQIENKEFDLPLVTGDNNSKTEVGKTTSVSSIFSSISSEETFSTYYVYIVRESDTIDSIIDKYKSTREELQNYNDLSDVKVGSKLIIPCSNHE